MKIEDSNVILGSQHHFESESTTAFSSTVSFRSVLDTASALEPVPETADSPKPRERVLRMLEQLIAQMLALLSGEKLHPAVVDVREPDLDKRPDAPAAVPRRVGEFAWQSEYSETIREHESSGFSASGTICTADGRSIGFDLELNMCRDFQYELKQSDGGKVALRDPLVINFAGQAAELLAGRFDFDLDGDGQSESIHGLAAGSAFLALDRDGDGRIGSGRELFGVQSGDGFADLASLDEDGNRWLDDADSAFARLGVWSRDAEGKESLSSLKDHQVGALYLGSAKTPFSLKDGDDRLRGQIRASGIYLHEDGSAGTLQQIDLAV